MDAKPVIEPILVHLPDDRWYNVTALFVPFIEDKRTFEDIAEDLDKAGEMLPFLIEQDEWNRLDVINASDTVNTLKRIFRKIKPVE